MIKFFKKLFGSEEEVTPPPLINKEPEDFDKIRVSVLKSEYDDLKTQIVKLKEKEKQYKQRIRDQKKNIASLKKM